MPYFLKNEVSNDLTFTHLYTGMNTAQLAQWVDQSLTSQKYKLRFGEAGNGEYEKGDRTMRLLFGALVSYSKIQVATFAVNDSTSGLKVNRTTTGMSGGLIGINQVKKELQRLAHVFSQI